MAYGDLKCRNLIWNTGSGDNTIVLRTLATQSYVTTNFAPKANPTFTGTINGADLILSGNLTVNGTQTIINTQTLDVEDKQIEIGKVSSPSDTTANEGGWKLKGASDKTFLWYDSTDAWTSSEHIHLGDNKKLLLGTGSDLQIFHDGSDSLIVDTGTGRLNIRTNGDSIKLQNTDGGTEAMGTFNSNGSVELYHNGIKKFETASYGVDIPDTLRLSNGWADTGSQMCLGADSNGTGYIAVHTLAVNTGSNNSRTLNFRIHSDGRVQIPNDTGKYQCGSSGDLSIFHDGTNSYINNTTGELRIRAKDGENSIVAYADGSVRLYHDNSNRLETTSGGVNVLGAITVNGTALSAAPEVTGTASGTITANRAVIVNSDGSFSNPTGTLAGMGANVSTTGSGEANPQNGETSQKKGTAYIGGGKVIICWRDSSNSYGRYKIGTINASNNSVTFGSQGTFYSAATTYISAAYHTAEDRIVVCFNRSNGYVMSVVGQLSGTSVTWGTVETITGSNTPDTDICYVPAAEKIALAYRNSGNNQQGMLRMGTVDGANKTISWASNMWGSGQRYNYELFALGANRRQFAIMYYDSGSQGKAFITTLSADGNSAAAFGSEISTNMNVVMSGAWDENLDCCVFTGRSSANSNRIQTQAVSIHQTSGSPVVTGSIVTIDSASGTDNQSTTTIYNPDTTTTSIYYGRATKYVDLTINADTMAITLSSVKSFGSGTGTGSSGITYGEGCYDTQNKRTFLFYSNQNDSGKGGASVVQHQPETNADSENVIGFSSAGYSNGQTATVNVVGNTTTQSSLTPGRKYYIQSDGSVGLTPLGGKSLTAGKAISTTKLLIEPV